MGPGYPRVGSAVSEERVVRTYIHVMQVMGWEDVFTSPKLSFM